MFKKDIDDERDIRAKEHFGKFRGINKWGWGSVSSDIKDIDPEAIKFIKNN